MFIKLPCPIAPKTTPETPPNTPRSAKRRAKRAQRRPKGPPEASQTPWDGFWVSIGPNRAIWTWFGSFLQKSGPRLPSEQPPLLLRAAQMATSGLTSQMITLGLTSGLTSQMAPSVLTSQMEARQL